MRRAYAEQQKREHGRRVIAVLPVHYPKELLTAHGILAMEMWGPPGPPRGPDAGRLQPYVCAVARNALAFLASGGADVADAVLVPHTCDSLQGLATLLPDFGGWRKKVFVFQHARAAQREAARRFVQAEMDALSRELGEWTGQAVSPDRLAWAIDLHRRVDEARLSLLEAHPLPDPELYALLRRGEWLWPEDHLAELRAVRGERPRGIPLLVTGYVPEPGELLSALNAAGLWIAADDYAAVGRRVARRPCPTSNADQGARMRHLRELFARSGARGVLVHVQKFCEPELFDVPAIRREFAEVPLLVIEGELEQELSAQTVTRIEAFAEMLRAA